MPANSDSPSGIVWLWIVVCTAMIAWTCGYSPNCASDTDERCSCSCEVEEGQMKTCKCQCENVDLNLTVPADAKVEMR